jgi:hypothetical protein
MLFEFLSQNIDDESVAATSASHPARSTASASSASPPRPEQCQSGFQHHHVTCGRDATKLCPKDGRLGPMTG